MKRVTVVCALLLSAFHIKPTLVLADTSSETKFQEMSTEIGIDNRSQQAEALGKAMFDKIWGDLCFELGDNNLKFPRQIVFLSGAPGAGKGSNSLAVMRALEIPNKPVEMSSLLTTAECEKLKSEGKLVGDYIVVRQLMKELLKPSNFKGIIIDGFPRTPIQAHFLKNLVSKLSDDRQNSNISFKMVNFSVSRETSINRQLKRGQEAINHNELAKARGLPLVKVRNTDIDPQAALKRFQTYYNLTSMCAEILHDNIDFYNINAESSLEEVRKSTYAILSK